MGTDISLFMVTGHIATDIQLRHTPGNGTAVVNFRIAVNHGKDRETSFFNCEAWASGAERIHRECQKGDFIALEGFLRQDTWVNREDRRMQKTVLRIERHVIMQRSRSERPATDGAAINLPKSTNAHTDTDADTDAVLAGIAGRYGEDIDADDISF